MKKLKYVQKILEIEFRMKNIFQKFLHLSSIQSYELAKILKKENEKKFINKIK